MRLFILAATLGLIACTMAQPVTPLPKCIGGATMADDGTIRLDLTARSPKG
jgi:hypothetical protein